MTKKRANTVNVTGHGVVRLTPDVATVTVGVDVTHPTLAEAQGEATRAMRAVIAAVRAADIADEDIQTSRYGVYVLRDTSKEGDPTHVVGFRVWNLLNVKVRQVDRLGSILDTVVGQGANTISAVTFSIDDASAGMSEARALAVEDARRKADELASAAGVTVGRVISISEISAESLARREVMYSRVLHDSSVPIEAGSDEATVDLQITYELR